MFLPKDLKEKYTALESDIKNKLKEFSLIPESKYFYELCFCICTPQSKAESAFKVQSKLEKYNFLYNDVIVVDLLRNPKHYIRFHNQKSKRLIEAKNNWLKIESVLLSDLTSEEKRDWIFENVKGLGMKESAHYLRNIGHRGLAILDRHILKHLVQCGVYQEIPNISNKKRYNEVAFRFKDFSDQVGIDMDELDLLFWSYEAGLILK